MTKRLTISDADYYLILGLKSEYQTESLGEIIRLEGIKAQNHKTAKPDKIPPLDELIDSGTV